MKRSVEGVDRGQSTLFPECLEDWVVEDNPVRVIDIFVDELDLAQQEESAFRDRSKRLLQQNRHLADITACPLQRPFSRAQDIANYEYTL